MGSGPCPCSLPGPGAPAAARTRAARCPGAPRTRDCTGRCTRTRPHPHPGARPLPAPRVHPTRTRAVTDEAAEVHFAADLAAGRVPSARRIKTGLHVGQDRAARIRDHLTAVVTAPR